MVNKRSIREMLQFQDLSEEEKQRRGILGRLYGPCASITDATRNGRRYDDELWQNVFSKNEIVKEMFDNGGIPMELDHPVDREETDSQRIAAMLPEPPKKDKDGHLICYVDIIDTPCGRIAYQLAKYGFKLGISSRGSGDVLPDDTVDPDTYDFTTFDLVLLPAVKDARLSMVESLSSKEIAFKKAMTESYNNSSNRDKEIMKETLEDLNINIDLDKEKDAEITSDDNDKLYEKTDDIVGYACDMDAKGNCKWVPLTDNSLLEDHAEEDTEAEDVSDEEAPLEVDEIDNEETVEEEPEEELAIDEISEEEVDDEVEGSTETEKDIIDKLSEVDKDAKIHFAPIVIDGKEYPVNTIGIDSEDDDDENVTLFVDYQVPEMDDNIDEDEIIPEEEIDTEVKDDSELEVDFISDDEEDWKELDWVVKESGTKAALYLSPCFGEVTMSRIPAYIIYNADKHIKAQLQIHKFFWEPTKKDV